MTPYRPPSGDVATNLGVHGTGATCTLALLATELALRRGSPLLLHLEEWTVGMCAARHPVALDAGGTRVLLVVNEDHGRVVGEGGCDLSVLREVGCPGLLDLDVLRFGRKEGRRFDTIDHQCLGDRGMRGRVVAGNRVLG